MSIVRDRIDAAVRNILAGDNACGVLANAVQRRDVNYFREAIAPVVSVYESEAEALRGQRGAALADAERKRFALEMVVANVPDLPRPVAEAVKAALVPAGGRR